MALGKGAELFDAGRYLEAHEAWEAQWRLCERGTAASNLMQGLAQCAAAAIKLQQGHRNGARSLARKGTRLVESAAAGRTALTLFAASMRELLDRDEPSITDIPRLRYQS